MKYTIDDDNCRFLCDGEPIEAAELVRRLNEAEARLMDLYGEISAAALRMTRETQTTLTASIPGHINARTQNDEDSP